jgi:voltage-gated potassium channel
VLKRWKFTALLLSALLLIVGFPMFRTDEGATVLYSLFLLLVIVTAILTLFHHFVSRSLALALGATSVAAVLADRGGLQMTPLLVALIFHALPAAFLLLTLAALLSALFRETDLSADSVNGAFCGYLLIGLLFAHLYCLIEAAWPASFALSSGLGPMPPEGHRRHFLFVYYSMITLTTVGYGDVTPKSDQARALALLEAMIGQFYIAVVLSQLIAIRISKVMADRGKKGDDKGEA